MESFRPNSGDADELPPDGSADSRTFRRSLKLSTLGESDLVVRVQRSRTQVRARYGMPQMVARSLEREQGLPSDNTQVAAAE